MSSEQWNTISFPKLGIEFPVYSTAFEIFGIEIKWYGILITIGVLLAVIYCFKRMEKVGLDGDRAVDAVFWGFIGAVVGARLYYVFMNWSEYSGNWKEIFAVRDGGLAIYGGVIGAILVGFIVAKIRNVRIAPLFDLAAMGFLIGQCIGRWGNFCNHEAFGSNTELPWGMTSPRIQYVLSNNQMEIFEMSGVSVDPTLPVHPCFLYESLWCLIGFILLHIYFEHRKFDGEIFFMYLGWYGFGRFFIEGLRTDSLMIGHLRISQLVAAISVVTAITVIIAMRMKIKSDGEYVFYKDTEESKQLIAESKEKEEKYQQKKQERMAKRKYLKEDKLKEEDKLLDAEDRDEIIENQEKTEDEENGKDN